MYINTNVAAMNSQRHVYQTNLDLDKSLERLSSGLRINSAADDASGLAIADKMNAQRVGISKAVQNTQDASALFKIAEGGLDQLGKMLSRIEELSVRAANQTLTASDRASIGSEVSELLNQIDTVSGQTEYNTIKLLNGTLAIQTSVALGANVQSGSIKVLDTANTVRTNNNLFLSVVNAGTPASANGLAAANAGSLNVSGTITVNGVDISVISSDTADTVVSKINAQNAKTNVVAVKTVATNFVSLVSGTIDADAGNIIGAGSAAANGSAIGYINIGSSQTIALNGNTSIWSGMGYTGGLAAYNASGTNASVNLGGVSMAVDSSKGGTILEMKNSGSDAYGIKVGIDIFNGGKGGYILKGVAGVASAQNRITASLDSAVVAIDTGRMLRLQVGANYNQNLSYSIKAMDTTSIGNGSSSKFGSLAQIDLSTASNANLSLKVVQKAIVDVADLRSAIGSILNRLDYTDKTLQVQRENMASAESKIRDADISLEMTSFTRQQILMQTGMSMLAQANSKPQAIMQLLK